MANPIRAAPYSAITVAMATPRLFQPSTVTKNTSSTMLMPLAMISITMGPRGNWVPISQPTRVYWHSTAGALQIRMAAYSAARADTSGLGFISSRPIRINGWWNRISNSPMPMASRIERNSSAT